LHQVALQLFKDNVPTLAVHAHIIRKLDEIFCPTAVYAAGGDVIEKIAGEFEERMVDLDNIRSELISFEHCLRICKQYATPAPLCKLICASDS